MDTIFNNKRFMHKFREYDRVTQYLLPPSLDDWLPKKHLARFVVDIIDQLDLKKITSSYSHIGEKGYDPKILLGMIFYGYATGVFSSRKIEEKSYTCLAFRYIGANQHPDHDTIANFRKRFLKELKSLFLQILVIAKEMGISKIGKVSLDGTKIKANASKHKALSYGYAKKLEEQLKAEIAELMKKAQEQDDEITEDGMSIPDEISIRNKRLAAIGTAMVKIEKRTQERYEQEKADYDAKMEQRKIKEQETGKKIGGKPPAEPSSEPSSKDQINLTDEESRIMPTSGKAFEQCYNAQASVDMETMMIVGCHVTNATNDKREIEPALQELNKLPKTIADIKDITADTGFQSLNNLILCIENNINPLIAENREKHHPSPEERFKEPPPLSPNASDVEKASHRLKTKEGKEIYAKRKSTVEPVFGIIKHIMGFRQFMLRGLENVSGEWDLVSIAWNLKRLHKLTT